MRQPSPAVAIAVILALMLLATGVNLYGNLHNSGRINGVVTKLKKDERDTKRTAEHTKAVQQAGEPVGRCLLDALEAVKPLLLQVPTVEKPLAAYIRLQSARYQSAPCPDK